MKKIALVLAPSFREELQSDQPVCVHTLCGAPMLAHVLNALAQASLKATLLLPEMDRAQLLDVIGEVDCIAMKESDLTHGELASELLQGLGEEELVLVTAGNAPLVTAKSMLALCAAVEREGFAAASLGAAAYCVRSDALRWAAENHVSMHAQWLDQLEKNGFAVRRLQACVPDEGLVVTDRRSLAEAATQLRRRINEQLMAGGVTMIDPDRVYVDCGVQIGRDTVIYPGCILENGTIIGAGCTLYANCRLNHAQIGNGVTIESSVILDARVADRTTVGPYAYIRPNTQVGEGCRIGDFVELKNSRIGNGTKVSHLTYVGDSDLGEHINLGCGVVFVNYDGKKKQRSTVGDHAFIGCNVNLVAPVNVGKDAYIAAGSTVTCDVPEGALLVAREREKIKEGWVNARKQRGDL